MRITYQFCVVFLLLILKSFSISSQEMRFSGPTNDESFIPIGWSSDGTLFAYAWFEKTKMVSNGSSFIVNIQNIITDKSVFKDWNYWDEGNRGDDNDGYYPPTSKKAWELVANKINKKLVEFDIWEGTGAGLLKFPIKGENNINIEIRRNKNEAGFEVYAVSKELGEKLISSEDKYYESQISVLGYFWNPDSSRIAIVINKKSFVAYSNYWVIGCHIKSGFENKGEK